MARRISTRERVGQFLRLWSSIGRTESSAVTNESIRLGEAPVGSAPATGGGKSGSRDPKLSIIKRIGLAFSGTSSDFEDPEFSFDDITNAYNAESFVRQAFDKYIEAMFKAGFEFVGKDPNAVEYVKMRFALMAEATQIPTRQLFIDIAEDLVKFSNVVIAKQRQADPVVFAGLNVQGLSGMNPVAGYFPLNLGTLKIKRDQFGTVKGWQQEAGSGGNTKTYKPDDIVHIYYKREKGRAFGTPFLVPALDDIRAFRQIEESVLRLVYRNLHPMWHIKVGIAGVDELGADETEVALAQSAIEGMDVEGGLVTNERVEIKPIAANQIIDAKEYLKHFEQRVFTALGVSELLMGRGNTANRSTGDNLYGEFADRAKAFQQVMEVFVNDMMVKEILMEGGYDPVMNPDQGVEFTFNEIDFDSQIKKQNQAVFLYEHEAITEDEMRYLLGRDPVQDGDERSKMHLTMVTLAAMEAEAALAPAPTTGSAAASSQKKKAETDNKTKPTNQHGTKSSPKKNTNSSDSVVIHEINEEYGMLRESITKLVASYYSSSDEKHLQTMSGALAYTEGRIIDQFTLHYSQEAAEQMKLPLKRMFLNLRDHVEEALNMEGDHALSHTQELTQTVFDIFADRLAAIAEKANVTQINLEKEAENIG